MRKTLLFLPLMAAMTLAGCSSEDEPIGVNENQDGTITGTNDYGYVAVNIVQPKTAQPKSVVSRAASTGFEYGSDAENGATDGLFFVFNSDGTSLVGTPQRRSLVAGNQIGNSPEVERIYSAVLVIDGVKDRPSTDLQLVCILNAPTGLESGVTTLSALTEKG